MSQRTAYSRVLYSPPQVKLGSPKSSLEQKITDKRATEAFLAKIYSGRSRLRVSDFVFRVSVLRFPIWNFWLWVVGFVFRVFGFRVAGFGFRVSGFGVWVSGFGVSRSGFRVSGFGFRVSCFGFRVSG